MATYSGNKDYLTIDGVDMSPYWREAEITPIMETADVTAGANVEHRERNEGLRDYQFSFTIVYDDTQAATILPLVRPGRHRVVYGPEGNTSGKPKHDQYFIFTEAPTGGTYEKNEARTFSVSGEAADTPIADMYNGGAF